MRFEWVRFPRAAPIRNIAQWQSRRLISVRFKVQVLVFRPNVSEAGRSGIQSAKLYYAGSSPAGDSTNGHIGLWEIPIEIIETYID